MLCCWGILSLGEGVHPLVLALELNVLGKNATLWCLMMMLICSTYAFFCGHFGFSLVSYTSAAESNL